MKTERFFTRIASNYTGASSNIFRFRLPCNTVKLHVKVWVGTGPSGGTALFDVNIAGTSIWNADQSQRITIPDGGTSHERINVTVSGTKGQEVTVDFDGFTGAATSIGGAVEIFIDVVETQGIVTTQFDKTTNTTLATVTGLSVALEASKRYRFQADLYISADTTGGHKYAIAGATLTATSVVYQVESFDNGSPGAHRITSRQTALGGAGVGQAGQASYFTRITGEIVVNAAGDLVVQFAQNASNGTSSVLVGSTLVIAEI